MVDGQIPFVFALGCLGDLVPHALFQELASDGAKGIVGGNARSKLGRMESRAIHEKLAGLGCSDAQGWFFSKALSAREVDIGFGARNKNGLVAGTDWARLAWEAAEAAA